MRPSPRMMRELVTVQVPTPATDAYADTVLVYAPGYSIRALVIPAAGGEGADGRQAVESVFEVYTDRPIGARCRVRWRRADYEVVGPPRDFGSYSVSTIRRVEG